MELTWSSLGATSGPSSPLSYSASAFLTFSCSLSVSWQRCFFLECIISSSDTSDSESDWLLDCFFFSRLFLWRLDSKTFFFCFFRLCRFRSSVVSGLCRRDTFLLGAGDSYSEVSAEESLFLRFLIFFFLCRVARLGGGVKLLSLSEWLTDSSDVSSLSENVSLSEVESSEVVSCRRFLPALLFFFCLLCRDVSSGMPLSLLSRSCFLSPFFLCLLRGGETTSSLSSLEVSAETEGSLCFLCLETKQQTNK